MQDQWTADGPQQAALQSVLRELNSGYLINESQQLRQAAADFEATIAGTAKVVLTETVTSAVEAVQREALRIV